MGLKELIADSHFAFLNQENETALKLALEAVKLEPANPNAYKCAGDACMSLEQYAEAIKYYSLAVKCDQNNGDRYYDLGFAYTAAEKLPLAVRNFARAEELGCSSENIVQLYHLLGIICFDIGRYEDALVNLNKAEQVAGIDIDILQRKAVIYGIKEEIRNGLLTANQIKLLAPSDYRGYQIAFKLLMQSKRLEEARRELDRAQKFAVPSMDYYFDCMAYELELYQADKKTEHLEASLSLIDKALKTLRPTITNVIEGYINAAELYLQMEKPDLVLDCLNAAQNPVGAYNNGFEISFKEAPVKELTEYDLEDMMEEDRARIEEEYGEYGLEELVAGVEPDEDGNREYFTEIEEEPKETETVYKLPETDTAEYTKEHIDQINRLSIGAYTVQKDFEKVIEYARKLQASESVQNSYIGKYAEANAMKELGMPDAKQKYEEIIRFFRNAMMKDPADIAAVTFRIQCCIDIGSYEEAQQICNLLVKDIREPLLDKIKEAKSGEEVTGLGAISGYSSR